ncbi:DEAD/DEAH box helicase [Sphingomonas sp. I4]
MTAIEAVRADLASGRPMDRLVVGDVGFGKTEVALRAAAVAALAGRQVVLAAPTTVLARQHLESFTARFAESGIAVAGLSRLSTAAEKRKVKAGLADGSIRVVIGTGAVAAKGVAYRIWPSSSSTRSSASARRTRHGCRRCRTPMSLP